MATTMTPNSVQRLTRNARRAILLSRAQNEIGRFSVWVFAVTLAFLLLSRWIPALLPMPWWTVLVVASLVAVLLGVLSALRTAPSLIRSAGVLDDRLRLSSRLRSALELSAVPDKAAPGFIALALRDAESLSVGLDSRAAREQIQARSWWVSSVLVLLIVVVGFWVPVRRIAPQPPKPELPTRALAGIDAASEIAQDGADDETPESVREELAELDALRSELEQGVIDQAEADARTAAKLEDLAQALDDASEDAREQAKKISESIEAARNQSQSRDETWDPRIDEFAESLRSQRYDEAARQIEELNESVEGMTPSERERLAEQLEQLADAVEPDPLESSRESPSSNDAPSSDEELPSDETSSSEETQSPEQQDSASEQSDQEMSQDSSAQESDSAQEQQPSSDPQQELSESLREQAQKLRESQEQLEDQESSESEQGEQRTTEAQRSSEEQEQAQEPTQSDERSQEGQRQETQEQSGQEQGEQDQQQKQEQSTTDQEQADQQGQEQSEQQEQDPQEQGEQDPQSQQGEQSQQRQGQEQGEQSPGQQEPQNLERRLRELDQQQRGARRNQEQAERLREQSQRLMRSQDQQQEDSDEGSARPMPQLQEQEQPQGGGDGERDPNTPDLVSDQNKSDMVPVDARDRESSDAGQPVGKWYGPEGEPLDPGQSGQTAQRFRRASEQAQRAIDEQQVPRRYRHLVREVFDRVKDRADAIEGGGSVAPQGKDATPSKPAQSTGSGE